MFLQVHQLLAVVWWQLFEYALQRAEFLDRPQKKFHVRVAILEQRDLLTADVIAEPVDVDCGALLQDVQAKCEG